MYEENYKPSEPGCSMKTAIRNFFSNYVTFSGRSSRSEYWYYALFNFLISIPFIIVYILAVVNTVKKYSYYYYDDFYTYEQNEDILKALGILAIIYLIWGLATFLPSLALSVRRLHDSGKSGWFLLLALIPLVGAIIIFIFTLLETEPFVNEYGTVKGRNYPHKYAQTPVYNTTQTTPEQPISASKDTAAELEKYGQLLSQGLLSQEEFDKIKKRLLNL